jgi:hypothetical protein
VASQRINEHNATRYILEVTIQLHHPGLLSVTTPAALTFTKDSLYPIYRRLNGPQSWYRRNEENKIATTGI